MNRLSATCLLLLLVVEASSGQRPRVSPKRLAVDVVSVQRGPQLYGAVLAGNATEGLTMAVERSWLEKTWPRYYQDLAAGERALATAASEGLRGRVERWRRSRNGDANLVLFLQQETARLHGAKEDEVEKIYKTVKKHKKHYHPLKVRPFYPIIWTLLTMYAL